MAESGDALQLSVGFAERNECAQLLWLSRGCEFLANRKHVRPSRSQFPALASFLVRCLIQEPSTCFLLQGAFLLATHTRNDCHCCAQLLKLVMRVFALAQPVSFCLGSDPTRAFALALIKA